VCDVFGVLCLECSWRRFSMGLIGALPPAIGMTPRASR